MPADGGFRQRGQRRCERGQHGHIEKGGRAGRMEGCFSGAADTPKQAPRGSHMGKERDISAGVRDVFPRGRVFAAGSIGARGMARGKGASA